MLPVTEILQTAVGHSREILFIRQEGRRNRERERERERERVLTQKGRGKELGEARTQTSK